MAHLVRRPTTFLEALQAKIARVTITSSSMRGPGCSEAITTLRALLSLVDVRRFSSRTRIGYLRELDAATDEILNTLSSRARYWGLARKGLNIFLKESLYCSYLRSASRIDRSERFLELPLDSLTGRALESIDVVLPRWDSIRRLTPATSELYQSAATREGARRGIARVHLDAFWWGHRGPVV